MFVDPEETSIYGVTVKQPWAGLIMLGLKTIETRPRRIHHRGPLVIHAGKQVDERAMNFFHLKRDEYEYCRITGHLLGVVDVLDCQKWGKDDEQASLCEADGLYSWYLKNPRKLRVPLMWRGSQGLFRIRFDLNGLVG